jgi:SepF-like predicted cell division protein (DUF552 family)
MGLLNDLVDDLKKLKLKKEEVEIPVEQQLTPINLRVEGINSLQDVEKVVNFIKEGDIVLVRSKISGQEAYKSAVKRLKDACTEVNGDIIGFGDNSLLIAPSNVKIVR